MSKNKTEPTLIVRESKSWRVALDLLDFAKRVIAEMQPWQAEAKAEMEAQAKQFEDRVNDELQECLRHRR